MSHIVGMIHNQLVYNNHPKEAVVYMSLAILFGWCTLVPQRSRNWDPSMMWKQYKSLLNTSSFFEKIEALQIIWLCCRRSLYLSRHCEKSSKDGEIN